jgi:hypothetical protein
MVSPQIFDHYGRMLAYVNVNCEKSGPSYCTENERTPAVAANELVERHHGRSSGRQAATTRPKASP